MKTFAEKKDFKLNLAGRLLNVIGNADNKGFSREQYKGHPVLCCEYAYSMGNSMSDFHEMVEIYETYNNWCGGFIWDYVDKSLRKGQIDGKDFWAYGGDYGERKSSRNVVADGIVTADRKPHHALFEVAKCYQNIAVELANPKTGEIKVRNKNVFVSTEGYSLHWEVKRDGAALESGDLDDCIIEPQESKVVDLPLNFDNYAESGEYFLEVSF